jgi:hypothetical protein
VTQAILSALRSKASQVCAEPDGTLELISRRKTIVDILKAERSEQL